MENMINHLDNSDLTIEDLINVKYREYWNYSNKNGKNAINPAEQIPEVVRKIIYAAYMLKFKIGDEHKTIELSGETAKFHPHGDSSIQDSIKGVATAFKSQPATRLLKGIGNFGYAPGDSGAAARYTSVTSTPLLQAIFNDIKFLPFNTDDTGLEQPDYISAPLPLGLINGVGAIGTGKSCYVAERNAKEVIEWIDELRKNNWEGVPTPAPMSVTGCKTWYEPSNGYIYYEAVVHNGVNPDDLTKKGRYDVITALPPKSNADIVITKLKAKLSNNKRVISKIVDGSGDNRPVWIIVPTGYLDEKDYNKYSMRNARKEQPYIWDNDLGTMCLSDITNIAHIWFDDRCKIVSKRLQHDINELEKQNHKINLIKIFAENHMMDWTADKIHDFYKKLDAENGESDAQIVLNQSARAFLPENIKANEITREKNQNNIDELNNEIKHIVDVVIDEAYKIIEKQEKFFA